VAWSCQDLGARQGLSTRLFILNFNGGIMKLTKTQIENQKKAGIIYKNSLLNSEQRANKLLAEKYKQSINNSKNVIKFNTLLEAEEYLEQLGFSYRAKQNLTKQRKEILFGKKKGTDRNAVLKSTFDFRNDYSMDMANIDTVSIW
jgi:hypothetical protein